MRMLRVLVLLLVVFTGAAVAQDSAQLGNGWMFVDNVDPIDDTGLVAVFKEAYDHPTYARDSAVGFRCEGGAAQVLVYLDEYLGSDDYTDVTHRFDQADPVTRTWFVFDGQQLYLSGDDAVEFFQAAVAASNVAFRAYDYNGGNLTYQVDLEGFAAAAPRVPCFESP